MPKYEIHLSTGAYTSITFETESVLDSDEAIEEAFWESSPDTPDLCHQCSHDRLSGQNLELGEEWEVTAVTTLGDEGPSR